MTKQSCKNDFHVKYKSTSLIKDDADEILDGTFTEPELQKTIKNNDVYRVGKIYPSYFKDHSSTAERKVDLEHGFHDLHIYCDMRSKASSLRAPTNHRVVFYHVKASRPIRGLDLLSSIFKMVSLKTRDTTSRAVCPKTK